MNFDKNLVLPHRDSSGLRSLPVNERDFKTKQKNALQPSFVEKNDQLQCPNLLLSK